MDPRITANLEVFNSTTVTIAGIWMGSRAEFIAALNTSGLNETTPFTLDELNASATEVEYTQALINLNGWEDVVQAAKYVLRNKCVASSSTAPFTTYYYTYLPLVFTVYHRPTA